MALPIRKYFNFEDAVTYLSSNNEKCSVSDLIHFAETERMEVICFFRGMWKFDYHRENDFRSVFIDLHKQQSNKHLSISQDRYTETHYTSDLCSYHVMSDDSRQEESPLLIMLRGFLSPVPLNSHVFWQTLMKERNVDIGSIEFAVPLAAADIDLDLVGIPNSGPIQRFTFENSRLNLTDFLITKAEIDLLRAGGRDAKEPHDDFKTIAECAPKSKTINSQNTLIHSLLKVYCPDAIDHPHAALGKAGKLTKAFAKAGIEFPVTPETLSKWIKPNT
ncbi:hypothetical protein AIG34_14300 [Salmonella enterica subsp. enterica serovar Rubislaw]|nr:hypothetical protein [Salmonella enterica]ECX5677777.1 hypothetical protein [Salmonella enterica subsp. enterica serovar Newport]ECZ7727197.1 hypothetical protein [Salmonella enterica subsp. enterica serovar Rubislaw]EED5432012.1 hypothetical protein [Salmonella enterica subsp. enterica serovar Rubislaw]EJC4630277.1 hypothetical protein [Salmonella enterica]